MYVFFFQIKKLSNLPCFSYVNTRTQVKSDVCSILSSKIWFSTIYLSIYILQLMSFLTFATFLFIWFFFFFFNFTASGLSCSRQAWLPCSMWDPSSPARNWICVPCTARHILNPGTTREVPTTHFFNLLLFLEFLTLFQYVFIRIFHVWRSG